MYNKYVKKNETPNFNLKQYVKLRAFWDDFVQYKTSEEGEERANRNKENASKRHTTIISDQVVIRVLFPSGTEWNRRCLLGGSHPRQ